MPDDTSYLTDVPDDTPDYYSDYALYVTWYRELVDSLTACHASVTTSRQSRDSVHTRNAKAHVILRRMALLNDWFERHPRPSDPA